MNWIPVSEQQPEGDIKALVFAPRCYPKITLGEFEFREEGEGYWIDCTEQYGDEGWPGMIEVTHWMPLPDPPTV